MNKPINFAIVLVMVLILLWGSMAEAYENNCTVDLTRCMGDPCQYVTSYRFKWPDDCEGNNLGLCRQCRHVYNACHDTATNVPCGWATCADASGEISSYVNTPHVPGVGPTCPAGTTEVR